MDKNGYKKNLSKKHDKDIESWNINDYYKVNISHHLSSYEIKIPFWKGINNIRSPYEIWGSTSNSPQWYKSYNNVKHNMIDKFNEATLNNVVDAFCGLVVLVSAQFFDDEILRDPDAFIVDNFGFASYKGDFMQTIKTSLLIKFPNDWNEKEKYDFEWKDLKGNKESFDLYPY